MGWTTNSSAAPTKIVMVYAARMDRKSGAESLAGTPVRAPVSQFIDQKVPVSSGVPVGAGP
jgi:hypothetical protein